MRVLYIDVDSLRPDHLGCYGYLRPTSPAIDVIAAEGLRFTNYFASDTPCLPSRAALFSGRPGIANGVVAHENTPAGATLRYTYAERYGDAPLLMHRLSEAGLHTVAFSSFANRHLAGWFHLGFREFHQVSLRNGDEDANEVNAVVLPWFREHANEDGWFVHLNYWDPHTFYTEPLEYFEAMRRLPAPEWPDAATIERQQSLTGVRTPATLFCATAREHGGHSWLPTMPDRIASRVDFEHLISGYDGAIRFCDEQLARVFEELDRQGVLGSTAIIISADHGEAFGELGQYMEHGSVSPAVQRVPLIIRWPGVTDALAGQSEDAPLTNLDLAPTLCELLGIEVPAGWNGSSFAGRMPAHGHLVLSHGLHTRQRAVFDGRHLYIRTHHPGLHLYEPRMLFDLIADPHQCDDVAAEEPGIVEQLDGVLIAWEQAHTAAGSPDPMSLLRPTPPFVNAGRDRYLQRLRDDGRDADADRLVAHLEAFS